MSRQEEQSHLELFRTTVSDFPEGTIDKAGERPDWVVHSPNGRIGVEHTRFHQFAPPMVAREVARNRAIRLAQEHATHCGCPPLQVFAQFRTDADVAAVGLHVLARAIAGSVMSNIPDVGSQVVIPNPPAPLIHLAVIRLRSFTRSHWQADKVGIVTWDFTARLNAVLEDKNKKYEEYLNRCDSCWLVIVAAGTSPSSFVDMEGSSVHNAFGFSFTRCFFLEVLTRRMFELRRA